MTNGTEVTANRCRSNCDRPVTVRLDALSQSGRTWTSYSCDDPDHYASCRNMIDALGFRFTGQQQTAPTAPPTSAAGGRMSP